MNIRLPTPLVLALAVANLGSAGSAAASFHFMQVEQIIAGVDGSTASQAVQLRMRSGNQNLVSAARLVAHDAGGANPVVLHTIPTNVSGAAAGSRVLLATAGFASATNPAITPDFTLVTPIPDTYIAAGSLTFESDGGLIYWRVSWGGAMTYGLTLTRASRVQVNVFDLAGRRVRVLADRDLPAGRNSLTWDPAVSGAGVLPGGVYFLRVRAGGEQRTARFVLLGRGAPMVHPDDH